MEDKHLALLALLSPGKEHAARIELLADDLHLGPRQVECLIHQLQARGYRVTHTKERAWIEWDGWKQAERAAEGYVDRHVG